MCDRWFFLVTPSWINLLFSPSIAKNNEFEVNFHKTVWHKVPWTYLNERCFYSLWSEVIETKRIHALPICCFSNTHTHTQAGAKNSITSHMAWNFIEMNFVIPITSTFTLARTTCSNRHSSPNVKLIVIIAHNCYQLNVAKMVYTINVWIQI